MRRHIPLLFVAFKYLSRVSSEALFDLTQLMSFDAQSIYLAYNFLVLALLELFVLVV